MVRVDASAYEPERGEKLRRIARWALLGAVSGLAATMSLLALDLFGIGNDLDFRFHPRIPMLGAFELQASPMYVAAGLAFGLIVGFALRRAGPAAGWRYPAFALASTLSYFAAVNLSVQYLADVMGGIVSLGIVAGLFGGGLLAAASAGLMPAYRHWRVCGLMTAAGGAFGVLLYIPITYGSFAGWLMLYAPWQAGYAAAMATAPELLATDRRV